MTKIWRFAFISILIGGLAAPTHVTPVQAAGCDDVRFIFARGSGEELNGPSATAWQQSIETAMSGSTVKYSFYELGSARQGNYQYPAVAVAGSKDGYFNLIGAYVSGGESNNFGASVAQGSGELSNYLTRVHAACPKTKFVLGGYSQGAMVVSRTLPQLPSETIIYAATFGDPKLFLPEGDHKWFGFQTKVPDACYGKNLSNYRAYVPNCYTYQGILGGYNPYQEKGYYNKLGAWCNDNDIMCSSGPSLDDHLAYVSKGLYQRAANTIVRKVKVDFPQKVTPVDLSQITGDHEVAILYNSSGAAEVLEAMREKIRTLGEKVLKAGGDLVLRSQTDVGSENGMSGYLSSTQCYQGTKESKFCSLSSKLGLTEFLKKVAGLEASDGKAWATGVIASAYNLLSGQNWRLGATKSLVIFSQGDIEGSTHNNITAEMLAELSLSIDPVNIYVVTNEEDSAGYAKLAELTNGGTFNVTSDTEEVTNLILGRPVAELAMESYQGVVGEEFKFDASSSAEASGTEQLHYDWDLNFDNVFEELDKTPVVTKTYDEAAEGYIQVRVRDDYGHSSTMSAKVKITEKYPEQATINANGTPLEDGKVQIDFQTNGTQVLVAVGDAVMGVIDPAERTSFTLTDLRMEETTVTLVSYSREGVRGESIQLQVMPLSGAIQGTTSTTTSDQEELDVTKPQVEPASAEEVAAIPKSPNSGAPRRRGDQSTM